MIVLDKSRQKAIHNRTIDTFIYEGSTGDTIVAEGMFKDRRFLDSYDPSGEVRPPYTVHHMAIRMEIKVPEMTIEAIEVEMPTVPREECLEVQACLAPVKGMRIAGGFIAQVRRWCRARQPAPTCTS
ncbi:DUF2889 domain-containing protein [Desulfosarcina cetonica]|uniref:DUF2889 domain-containing protein n=1 Tax=Desulfosarcina cetonica TaxID=90730 RepID=UPI0006CF580F|nr:DUF2889 domain-containing protein [Desulfosarcina cetonica]